MTESTLMSTARQWVVENYTHNNEHLLKTVEWLDRIAPDATEAMRLAALTHDMERAFPGPDQPKMDVLTGFSDESYYAAHSARSARIVGEWLRQQNADDGLIERVERLVRAHEDGGWPEADLIQAADSLSFLEVNVDLFLNMVADGSRTVQEVHNKLDYTYERIQVEHAKELALPLYRKAKARVTALQTEQTDS